MHDLLRILIEKEPYHYSSKRNMTGLLGRVKPATVISKVRLTQEPVPCVTESQPGLLDDPPA